MESFIKARATLDRSINAYGGRDSLTSIANVSIKIDGDSVHRNQSRRPGDFDRTDYTGELVFDLKNVRILQTQKGQYPGGFRWENGVVIDAGNRTGFDLIRRTSTPSTPVTIAAFKAATRWLPQLVILNALEQAETLRYLGKADYDKRPHEVIDYVANDGARLALYIDEQTGLLSKYEMFITDRFSGDSIAETRFTGQKKVGNFIVPAGRISAVNGDVTNDYILSGITFNSELRSTLR